MVVSRRRALIGAGVAALAGLGGTITWADLEHRARTEALPPGTGILVVVTLYGGNDGINTVIPYADNAYHDARPDLAYRPEQVLRLDERLGLNPAMTGLHRLWDERRLAVLRGVGYPRPDHSHFRSMDIWQTASPAEPVPTGWIGRWLDAAGADPVRAVHIGADLPQLAIGSRAAAAALVAEPTAATASALDALAAPDSGDTAAEAAVRESYDAARRVRRTFSTALVAAGRGGHRGSLASQLDVVARCVRAGAPTRVYSVSLGGLDTHADERGTQQRLLGEFDAAVANFLTGLADHPRGRDVVLLAYSEFGRRVRANASHGTDHGTAGPVFVAGAPVVGGFYGAEPSLTDLDDGDLKFTVDFRDVYHELLHRVLDADPIPILGPAPRRDLGFCGT